jgi:hypothetical protein
MWQRRCHKQRFRDDWGNFVRHERPVEYAESTHERLNDRIHILNLFQPVQVGCKHAGAGAVPAADLTS